MLNGAREIVRPLQLASSRASAALAGRGFINLRLADGYWQKALTDTLAAGAAWAAEDLTKEDES